MLEFNKYASFQFEDFIEDKEFRNWVTYPTRETDKLWDEFLQSYPDKKEAIKDAREFLLDTRHYFESTDISERDIQIRFGRALEKASASKHTAPKPVIQFLPVHRRVAVAASVAILLGIFAWWYTLNLQNGLTTYSTNYGEWKTVQLPDGSMVKLNANSELILAEDWSEEATRQVWLKGEAFFTVAKKPVSNSKFQVITDDLTVEVLGTEFNVQDRGEHTEVYLHEGMIKLDMGVSKENLKPGDFIAFSAGRNEVIQRKHMSEDEYSSWKEGVLQLKNTTILIILREIEEIYGVEIKVSNKTMLSEKRTIGVPMKNLEIVIPILEKTLDVEITKDGNKLFVK